MSQKDVDLARRIADIATARRLTATSAAVSVVELSRDTRDSATVAPLGPPC
ncbi:hypothetical protein [Cellulomonas dongxiuzhuiae]|uniref:Uncharacterized protein n=1 Tax=Cellulomonas dongxiuzhuiae TaxID=2819979 RepID=A0ABX8GJT1_9CELL|nr:hypothetical protein [Cellulomonas dongxiuzhuiae]MBO3095451.1 hypothetical protein [Cellulomonas dongxiuzhuiae]QWC16433.1 hypothetical protein KKR89_01785 [Cellulomonas dongxiuzhuiae]